MPDVSSSTNAQPLLADPPKQTELRWWHWVVLSSVSVLGPFSTDSYIPNLPQMASELACSQSLAGLTLQVNWIVSGLAMVAVQPSPSSSNLVISRNNRPKTFT